MAGQRDLIGLIVLGGVAVALGIWIRDEGARPLESPAALALAEPEAPAELPRPGDFRPAPFERFAAALDRPLFSETRRPVAPAAQPAPEPDAAPALTATLTGVLFAASGSVALVTEVGASAPVRISEGGALNGWTLIEIRPDTVVFEQGGETVTLELIYRDDRPPPQKKRDRKN